MVFWLSHPAFAQNKTELPPLEDFVLRFSSPDLSTGKYYSTSSREGTLTGGENGYKSASTVARINIDKFYNVTLTVFEKPITLADRAAYWTAMEGILPYKIHKTGFNEALGRETYFLYLSPTQVFKNGKFVAANQKAPTGLKYVGLYDDRAILEVEYDLGSEPITEADVAAMDDFVETVSVTFEEFFDQTAETYLYTSPDLLIYLAPGEFLRAQVDLEVPRDWIVEETILTEAAAPATPAGEIQLDIGPFEETAPGTADETFRIRLFGLTAGDLTPGVFRQTEQGVLGDVVRAPALLSSEVISEQMEEFIFGGHCLSDYKGSANNGGVRATTYTGLNREGAPIKALHVSGGGYHLACHYIYSAPPDRFDQNIDMVMGLLGKIRVTSLGAPLKR